MKKRTGHAKLRGKPVASLNGYLMLRELPVDAQGEFLSVDEVREKVFRRTQKQFARITVYGTLNRGENNGQCWASWRIKEGRRQKGERRVRVFALTDKGQRFVNDFAEKLELWPAPSSTP